MPFDITSASHYLIHSNNLYANPSQRKTYVYNPALWSVARQDFPAREILRTSLSNYIQFILRDLVQIQAKDF